MVMADRPEVATAPAPIAAIDLLGLAESMGTAFLRVPFRQPWRGAGNVVRNVGVSVTREMARSFLGYATSLPVDEFRSIEKALDTIAGDGAAAVGARRARDHGRGDRGRSARAVVPAAPPDTPR